MATPFVSSAAALVKASDPGATAMGIKALLLRSSDPVASLAGKTTSGGRLDASAAVHCAGNGEVWIASAGTYTIVVDPQQAYTGAVTVAVTSP